MPPPVHSRFVSEAKSRIGKCITFGLSQPSHFIETAHILRALRSNWRKLIVGREGYNTNLDKAGLSRHRIAWGDHDQMGHVNNVVYNFWAETARINWARSFGKEVQHDKAKREMWEDLLTPRGIGLILRSIKTEYKFPLQYPDRVTVIHRLLQKPKKGMDALHLEAVVLSETHQRIAAKITEDIAVYDYRIRQKAPLPEFMVETLMKEWELQERSAKQARNESDVLQGKLKKIEKETWDREDAVEDLGSAVATSTQARPAADVKTEKIQQVEKNGKLQEENAAVEDQDKVAEAKAVEDVVVDVGKEEEKTRSGTKQRRDLEVDETPLEYQVSHQRR